MRHSRALCPLLLPGVLAAGLLLSGPFGGPATAQEPDQLRSLIDELNVLLDKGEKERLADPWYLRDLRSLVSKYDWPWQKRLFSDDFSAQGPAPAAPWKVTAGEFLIDWRHGLRTVVEPPQATQAQPQTQEKKKLSQEEVAGQILGSILNQALGTKQQKQQQAETQQASQPASDPGFAAAVAPVRITNAFALEVELTARKLQGQTSGRLELGPYQGANAAVGYRLVINHEEQYGRTRLELLRISSRGTATLEFYDQPLPLADGQPHSLLWTRDRSGNMTVSFDGREIIAVSDRSFRDPFDGLAIINSGGDYAFRKLVIDGTA